MKKYLNIESNNDSDFEDEGIKKNVVEDRLYNSEEYELVKSIVDYEIEMDKIIDCEITELEEKDIENSDIKLHMIISQKLIYN